MRLAEEKRREVAEYSAENETSRRERREVAEYSAERVRRAEYRVE
jgi:hypothetical protein